MTGKAFFLFPLLTLLVAGCGARSNLAEKHNDFGIKSAKMGLWNEAIMRWERVIEIVPNNAQAHNNLGVAYESKREFEAAQAEYETAIELDPENKSYKKNYDKFKRNRKRVNKGDQTQESKQKAQEPAS